MNKQSENVNNCSKDSIETEKEQTSGPSPKDYDRWDGKTCIKVIKPAPKDDK